MNDILKDYYRTNLKHVLNDVKADKVTRDIAKGLSRTNPKMAVDYAEGLPLRRHAEKPIRKFYEEDIKES